MLFGIILIKLGSLDCQSSLQYNYAVAEGLLFLYNHLALLHKLYLGIFQQILGEFQPKNISSFSQQSDLVYQFDQKLVFRDLAILVVFSEYLSTVLEIGAFGHLVACSASNTD